METRITATEMAKSLSDVLNRVRYRGEHFLIERSGELVASLAPAGLGPGVTLRELATRLRHLPPPGEGFADDLEALQTSQPRESAPPWPS